MGEGKRFGEQRLGSGRKINEEEKSRDWGRKRRDRLSGERVQMGGDR